MKVVRSDDVIVRLEAEDGVEHIQVIQVELVGGSIEFWVRLRTGGEFLQYLGFRDGMALGVGLVKYATAGLGEEVGRKLGGGGEGS